MATLAPDTLAQELDALDEHGFVVLPALLGAHEIEAIRAALAPHFATTPTGRNAFEGRHSQRVYALLAKSAVFADLVSHPRILRLLDHPLEPNYLLSSALAINNGPGEARQQIHFDDSFYRSLPRPRASIGASVIWAIDEFTETNGATEILPGSHRWGNDAPDQDDPRIRKMAMPAGSALVFHGTLWHRGGANRSEHWRLAITPQYCQPWARQAENMTLAVPPAIAATYPRRVQELIGYSLHVPFMGHVNGMHPARLIDPHYDNHERQHAVRAVEYVERARQWPTP
jgi:ectoine hydroxylase-related dioxygenase (phytanoyl-CoA dioxygenase family)